MQLQPPFFAFLAIGSLCAAIPTGLNIVRAETADANNQVVYTWSLPETKVKDKRVESADADDQIVYTWSLPEEKRKRAESADSDDQVVYTWYLPEEK